MIFVNKKNLLELRDSIRRRGFWVNLEGDEFILDRYYSEGYFYHLVNLLNEFSIPVEVTLFGFKVTADSIPSEALERLETMTKREEFELRFNDRVDTSKHLGLYSNSYHLRIMELDYGLASLVFALNKVGFTTAMSCDGHGERKATIWFNYPQYIPELNELLEEAAKQHSLAYDWEIKKDGIGFILVANKRLKKDKYDSRKVQDDTCTLSEFIIQAKDPLPLF